MATLRAFQIEVSSWMLKCFGASIAADKNERACRFLEEALELAQATGLTRQQVHKLVNYTYDRPIGDAANEVGGTMVTLAALCSANGIDLQDASTAEVANVWTKIEKIRAKQAAKRARGITSDPLP